MAAAWRSASRMNQAPSCSAGSVSPVVGPSPTQVIAPGTCLTVARVLMQAVAPIVSPVKRERVAALPVLSAPVTRLTPVAGGKHLGGLVHRIRRFGFLEEGVARLLRARDFLLIP